MNSRTVALAVLLALVSGCGAAARCDVEASAAQAATAAATQCGHFSVTDDASNGIDCATAAQAAGHAFLLQLDQLGTDSTVTDVFVRTPTGESYWFAFDSRGDEFDHAVGPAVINRITCEDFSTQSSNRRLKGPTLACDGRGLVVAECR